MTTHREKLLNDRAKLTAKADVLTKKYIAPIHHNIALIDAMIEAHDKHLEANLPDAPEIDGIDNGGSEVTAQHIVTNEGIEEVNPPKMLFGKEPNSAPIEI